MKLEFRESRHTSATFRFAFTPRDISSSLLWQTKSIPGQVKLSQIGGLNYWFIHPYKKLSQIGGLFSWFIRPYKKLSQIGGLISWVIRAVSRAGQINLT